MKNSSYFDPKVKKKLNEFFDKTSMSRLAKTSGFLKRKAKKITAFNFVAAFLICCSKGQNTYSEWARQITLLSGISLTRQALWERVHEGSVAFAKSLLEKLLLKQAFTTKNTSVFSDFKRVLLGDSTTLRLPDSLRDVFPGSTVKGVQRACARIQTIIELKTMRFLKFTLGAFTDNDQGASKSILDIVKKGDLLIRDMGYFSLKVFEQLIKNQVHFLSRLKYGVNLYDINGCAIVLKDLLSRGKKVDRWVYVGSEQKVWVRLVMIPLSKKEAAERVRKARQHPDKRYNHSDEYYQWIRYSTYITTVEEEIWEDVSEVAEAYRVRWQIEIIFKSWKSGFHMQSLLHEWCGEEQRVKTTIYLLLMFMTLFMQKVYVKYSNQIEKQSEKVISLVKLAKFFFLNMIEMFTWSTQKIRQQLTLYCCYDKRYDRMNMTQLINSF